MRMSKAYKKGMQMLMDKQTKECCKTWVKFWCKNSRNFDCEEIEFNYCGGCRKKIKGLTEKEIERVYEEK